ncbi:helix-turn-helix transcriptional regulator [Xanthocytophaga agilis]|uniref:Helix-turn-helix transcriptional regulator n=1 Tax=Xanthocytophaga agilis TaxID=3048010 RepID=A0AAE3R7F2_9BACT|nr:helix-turn-helix transcriptional regulator [Xanthocytophaga agilis]MDJ1505026.1 helix-turn-helix transcriptional regulator [Xanthocytophaga agilis]
MERTIKQLRTQKRLSVAETALFLGVSKTAVYNYEAGIAKPTDENKRKLAELYDTTVEDIESRLNSIEQIENSRDGDIVEWLKTQVSKLLDELARKDEMLARKDEQISILLSKLSASEYANHFESEEEIMLEEAA